MEVYVVSKVGYQFDKVGAYSTLQKAKDAVTLLGDVTWTDLDNVSYYYGYSDNKWFMYLITRYEVDR